MESSSSDYGTPFRSLLDHCEQNNLRFRADPDHKSVHFSMCWNIAVYGCTMRISHEDEVMQIFLHFPVMAKDPAIRPAAAELVARANHGLTIGHLDIDMDDGEIHYHVGHVLAGNELEDAVIGNLLLTALTTSERYFVALMRLMFGGNTPGDAIYLAELDSHVAQLEDATPSATAAPPAGTLPPVPSKKRRTTPRRKAGPKSTDEFPGFLDVPPQPPAANEGEPQSRNKDDPQDQ